MKKVLLIIGGVVLLAGGVIFIILNGNRQEKPIALTSSPTLAENTSTPLPTETPLPPTATATVTPTATITVTPSIDPQAIELLYYDFYLERSSSFGFNLNYTSGDYFGQGVLPDGSILNYTCRFDAQQAGRLVCSNGAIPYGGKIDFSLLRADTRDVIYRQIFLYDVMMHGEVVPTPMGMNCELEPQWNGGVPDHELGYNCFAISCWQNGKFFWGSNNTCETGWPFDWDFVHPLYTPGP